MVDGLDQFEAFLVVEAFQEAYLIQLLCLFVFALIPPPRNQLRLVLLDLVDFICNFRFLLPSCLQALLVLDLVRIQVVILEVPNVLL